MADDRSHAWTAGFWRQAVLRPAGLVVLLPLLLAAGPQRGFNDEQVTVQPAAFAEEVDPPRRLTPRATRAEPRSNGGAPSQRAIAQTSVWGTVIGLLAVFCLFVAAKVWLTKHGPAGLRGLPAEALELLGRRSIEPRVSIHLVRCGPKILVLGVGPDGVRTLSEITDAVDVDLLAGACRKKESTPSRTDSFAGLFRRSALKVDG